MANKKSLAPTMYNRELQDKKKQKEERNKSDEWGVPDWRKSEGYPPMWDALCRHKQKWEFLRRNAAYRSDWLRYKSVKVGNGQKTLGKLYADIYSLKKFIDPKISWQDFHEKFVVNTVKGCGDYPIMEESHELLCSMGYVAPKLPIDGWDKELKSLAQKMRPARDVYGLIVNVTFNLEFSAKDQARFVEKRLIQMQKVRKALMQTLKQPRNSYNADDYIPVHIRERNRNANKRAREKEIKQDNRVLLLRVYDASNCGVAHEEIAQGLTEDGTLTQDSWDASTISRKISYARELWRQM